MAGQKARLWNRSDRDFSHVINDVAYNIPARGCITLSMDEAVSVQGFYPGKGTPWPVELERLPLDGSMGAALQLFTCPKDNMNFGSKEALDAHLLTHTDQVKGDDVKLPEKAEKSNSAVYVCFECDREFPSKQQLALHMKSHKAAKNDSATGVHDGSKSV